MATKAKLVYKGGTGSGNHGHSGRPGKIGGSAGGGSGVGAVAPVTQPTTAKPVGIREVEDAWPGGSDGYVKRGVPKHIADDRNLGYLKGDKSVFTFGDSFFYSRPDGAGANTSKVKSSMEANGFKVEVVAQGETWNPFTGGAAAMSNKDSFYWTVARITK